MSPRPIKQIPAAPKVLKKTSRRRGLKTSAAFLTMLLMTAIFTGSAAAQTTGTNSFSFWGIGEYITSFFSDDAPQGRRANPFVESLTQSENATKSDAPMPENLAPPCASSGNTISVVSGGSIQAAINAANPLGGDTIEIAAGTYTEQLIVNKCVFINGAGQGSTIIQSPATLANSSVIGITDTSSIVEIRSVAYVTMSNLTVTGPVPFDKDVYGIYVVESATLDLNNARVTAIHKATGIDGVQRGNAVRAGSVFFNQIGSLDFDNVTIDDYQKTGVIASRAGSTVAIANSTFTGAGAQTNIGQNGIQLSDGVTATITNNTIKGNVCNNAACSFSTYYSYGILAFDMGALSITGNTFNNNDAVLYSTSPGITTNVDSNTVTQVRYSGFDLDQGTSSVSNNFIIGSTFGPITGIGVLSYNGNTANTIANLHSNSITGASQAGISVDDFDTGDAFFPVVMSADFNRIAGNAKGIDNNTTTSTVSQTNNFWGCNQGPNGGTGCDTTEGLVDVSTPYLILSNTTATPNTVSNGGTSAIQTNLRFNNLGTDTFTATNHLPNPIASTPTSVNNPNGIPVNFSVNNPAFGSVSPTTAPLVNGLASTTFTGGSVNGGDKIAVVTAQVDNATNSVNVTVLDTIVPTVISMVGSFTAPNLINYTVTFSENVTGVDAGDFNIALVSGNVVSSISSPVSCTGNVCTVQITVASGMGSIRLDLVDNDSIVDTAGTPNKLGGTGAGNGNASGNVVAVDIQMPSVTINRALGQTDPTSTSPINFAVVFDEPITGFNASDVTATSTGSGTLSVVVTNPSSDNRTFNVAVSGMTSSGDVSITFPAGAAMDADGNTSNAPTVIDNTVTFTLVSTNVLVSPADTKGWTFVQEAPLSATTSGTFVTGPATPPIGTGSARLTVDAAGGQAFIDAKPAYANVRFDQITNLSFSTYQTVTNAGTITFQFNLETNVTTPGPNFQGRLVYEPIYDPANPAVQTGAWQNWNALSPTAVFWASPNANTTVDDMCPQGNTFCTRAFLLANFPNLGIRAFAASPAPVGVILFKIGGGIGAPHDGNVDNFVFGVNSANTTFNFDEQPPTLSIGDVSVVEGTTATFTVTQSVVSQLATTFTVNTNDVSATAGSDYVAISNQTFTIPANSTTLTVSVPVTTNPDTTVEGDETFNVNLSNAVNAGIVDGQGVGTILNDDIMVTINQAAGQVDPTSVSPITFDVIFSESVTGFGPSDVVVTGSAFGGAATRIIAVSGSGATYTVSVSGMNQSGTVTASIPAGGANGANGTNVASTSTDNTVFFNFVVGTPVNVTESVNPTNVSTPTGSLTQFFFQQEGATGSGAFVTGPGTPPLGIGSAQLTIDSTGREILATRRYAGTRLADITALQYSAYTNRTDGLTITLQFDVDYDLSDANGAFQNRLVYEPAAQAIPVAQNTWQDFDALTGKFYSSSINPANPGFAAGCTQAAPCTRQQLLTFFPNVGILGGPGASFPGALYLRAGGPFAGGMVANADKLVVGINGNTTRFDFEPTPPTISVSDATVTEGDSGTTTATFTVTQSVASQLATTVTVNTANGTATTADNDYVAVVNQTVTIPAGQTTATFTVTVNGDVVFEPDETFTVNLTNAVNAGIVTASGTGTITNDEAVRTVSITNTSGGNEAGLVPNTFTVTLSGASASVVTVGYATSDNTPTASATAGNDYTATSGTLTFNPGGPLTQTFTVATLQDAIVEGTETFNATLSNSMNATIAGTNPAVGTIADNDTCSYTINGSPATSGVAGGNGSFTVTVNSGCPVSAVSNSPFITGVAVSADNGTSTRTITYTVASNAATATNSGAARSGTITVTGTLFTGTFTVNQAAAAVNVSIPTNQTVQTGSTLLVPVNVDSTLTGRGGPNGVTAYEFTVQYDPRVLMPVLDGNGNPTFNPGTMPGADGFSVATTNTVVNATTGIINVSGLSANPLTGTGILLFLKFTVNGTYNSTTNPACSSLSFVSFTNSNVIFPAFEFNDGVEPVAATTNGQACVIAGDVSGRVVYGNPITTTTGVPNVTLTATRLSSTFSTTTNSTGNYSLSGFSAGTYTVTPTKAPVPNTMSSATNPIRTADAALIQQYRLGLATLTPRQLLAADVDQNGTVQTFDASLIQQYRLRTTPVNPTNQTGNWKFIPPNRVYTSIPASVPDEDYEAILLGDVDGDYASNPFRPNGDETGGETVKNPNSEKSLAGIPVTLPNASYGNGTGFSIPVGVSNLTAADNVTAYEFDLVYRNDIITPMMNSANGSGTLSSNFFVGSNVISTNGNMSTIRVSAFSGNGQTIVGSGVLVNLGFTSIGSSGQVSPLSFDAFIFNAGTPGNMPNTGTITILGPTAASSVITGRLTTSFGRGVGSSRVTLTNSRGISRTTVSNSLGFYRFNNVQSGETYYISVSSKRYQFTPQAVSVASDLSEVNLIAEN